jgi:hypothetical protein
LVRRGIALSIVPLLLWASASYALTLLQPSNVGVGVRSVEWIRDHGGAGLVSAIERLYYSQTGPSRGGKLNSLPAVGASRPVVSEAGFLPPRVPPFISPPLPGEGVWRGTGALVAGAAPVLVTTFRPDPVYPTLVAGVAWMDRSRVRLHLYPGRYQPPMIGLRGPMEVPASARAQLLATFNSGFKLQDSGGGFFALGQEAAPLRAGLATFVGYRDGRFDVQPWNGGSSVASGVAFARQNLRLIVDRGRLNPDLRDGPAWGVTLGNAIRVWRSGVGVDARGNLLFAAADGQTVSTLAKILQRAGAVRAMQLDINAPWVTFNSYGHGGTASKLLPAMKRPATRYLTPDDRDFFAVTARSGA